MRDDDGLDADDRKLLNDIDCVGWHMVGAPEDEQGPGFVYSIGLWQSFRHAEIVVVGLNMDVAFWIVNEIGSWARAGQTVRADDIREGLLEGYSCTFRTVEKQYYRDYFGYGLWFYRCDSFPVLQCIWPDKQRRWPWDCDFNPQWKPKQPVLE